MLFNGGEVQLRDKLIIM